MVNKMERENNIMNNIEFINNAYTEDGLRLPMVHFDSKEKEIMRLYNDFWDRFIPAIKRGEHPEKVSYETVEEKGDVL